MERKTYDETGARGWFTPYVAAVVANSLTCKREPKSQPILLPGGDERFEQPIADTIGDSGTRVFQFDVNARTYFSSSNANLPAARHRLNGISNQVKEHTLNVGAHERQLYPNGNV